MPGDTTTEVTTSKKTYTNDEIQASFEEEIKKVLFAFQDEATQIEKEIKEAKEDTEI